MIVARLGYTATVPAAPAESDVGAVRGETTVSAKRTFAGDVAASFRFPRDKQDLIVWLVIGGTLLVAAVIAAVVSVMGLIGRVLALLLVVPLTGYVFAYCAAVMRGAAEGEQRLPTFAFTDLDDLFGPLFQFIGAWVYVLFPAMAMGLARWLLDSPIPWRVVVAAGAVGVFFWPAVMLGVAMVGGFHGMMPHLVIRTALAAPRDYLLIWGVLLGAIVLTVVPVHPSILEGVARVWAEAICLAIVACPFVSLYAAIVTMRAIGLYYYHHKARFPWKVE